MIWVSLVIDMNLSDRDFVELTLIELLQAPRVQHLRILHGVLGMNIPRCSVGGRLDETRSGRNERRFFDSDGDADVGIG